MRKRPLALVGAGSFPQEEFPTFNLGSFLTVFQLRVVVSRILFTLLGFLQLTGLTEMGLNAVKTMVEKSKRYYEVLKNTTGYVDLTKYSSFREVEWKFKPLPITYFLYDLDSQRVIPLTKEDSLKGIFLEGDVRKVFNGKTFICKGGHYYGCLFFSREKEKNILTNLAKVGVVWHFAKAFSCLGRKTFKCSELASVLSVAEGDVGIGRWVGVVELDFSSLSPLEKRKVVWAIERTKPVRVKKALDYPSNHLVIHFVAQYDLSIWEINDRLNERTGLVDFLCFLEDNCGIKPYQLGKAFAFFRKGEKK